jgi:hypothetical protein
MITRDEACLAITYAGDCWEFMYEQLYHFVEKKLTVDIKSETHQGTFDLVRMVHDEDADQESPVGPQAVGILVHPWLHDPEVASECYDMIPLWVDNIFQIDHVHVH